MRVDESYLPEKKPFSRMSSPSNTTTGLSDVNMRDGTRFCSCGSVFTGSEVSETTIPAQARIKKDSLTYEPSFFSYTPGFL